MLFPSAAGRAAGQQPRLAMTNWKRGRRNFLIATVVLSGSVAAGVQFGLPYLRRRAFDFLSEGGPPGGGVGENPTLWLELTQDNHLHLHVPKVEMGQGVHTALGQIAAEELEIPWENVQVLQASTLIGPSDNFGTGGSASVSGLYLPLRQLAANYRLMLTTAASETLGDSVILSEGIFRAANGSTMTLGSAAALPREWVMPKEDALLKPKSEFLLIGKSLPRVDYQDMLTAVPRYAYDMHASAGPTYYGAAARPPMIGAAMGRVSASAVRALPEVVDVVVTDHFAGVIAKTREAAWAAADKLDIEWALPRPFEQDELDKALDPTTADAITLKRNGKVEPLLSRPGALSADYRTPFAATAVLEPQSSFAEMGNDQVLRVRTPTQFPNTTAKMIAKTLDIDETQVDVLPTYLGGGFGRRSITESATEAAILAYASGFPVHVGWRREDEFLQDRFRPPTWHRLTGRVGKDGQIEVIQHLQASGDVLLANLPPVAAAVLGSDFGATRGIKPPYSIANLELRAKRVPLPVPTASWRGLGLLANTFANESFVDELAASVKKDPLQFRLQHLAGDSTERLRRALMHVGTMSDWEHKRNEGAALGIACCQDYGTVVAQVAEVEIDNNLIRVRRIWAVMDCGQVVNPNGAINQVEGNIVWGTSSALKETITFQSGKPVASNFDRYPLQRLDEAPKVQVELLPSDLPPQGVGEPAIGPVPAAIANAVYAATGQRLRTLPLAL